MDREIIRHSEGYWSLVDEQGQSVCKFKIGDKVKIAHVMPVDALQNFDKYNWGKPNEVKVEETKGVIWRVSYVDSGCLLEVIGRKRYIHSIGIKSILKMEVKK